MDERKRGGPDSPAAQINWIRKLSTKMSRRKRSCLSVWVWVCGCVPVCERVGERTHNKDTSKTTVKMLQLTLINYG